MDSTLARVEYDFIFKSGQVVQFNLGEKIAWQNQQTTSAQKYNEWGIQAL